MVVTTVGKEFIVNRLSCDSTTNTINGFGWGSTYWTSVADSVDTNLIGPVRYESVYAIDTTGNDQYVFLTGYLSGSDIGGASDTTLREVGLFLDSATPTPMFARAQLADLTKDSSFTLTCNYSINFARSNE